MSHKNAFDFQFVGLKGDLLPLSQFKGQVVLVVNTASQCGFTKQYKDLEDLWQRYQARGLVVIGVPSNDFGDQEPGTESEIAKFCHEEYNVTFQMTQKTTVSGAQAHPFYRWALSETGFSAKPRWNFHKYLINPEGQVAFWFSAITRPTAKKVVAAIESLLPE